MAAGAVQRYVSIKPLFYFSVSACLLVAAHPAAWAQAAAAREVPAAMFSSSLADLPDSPDQQSPTTNPDNDEPQQTKRILGIVPNFRAVSTSEHLPPQSVKEKFITATQDSFDYSSILIPAAVAAYDLGTNQTPEFGTGGAGYGRYFWHAALDQTSENYFVEFIVPAVTHQDTRFYTLRDGNFWTKAGYAMSRIVVTRADNGHNTFNVSEVLGSGMSAGLSNAYYPSSTRTFSNTARNWGIDLGIDALSFAVREFWPDINHALKHK
jgi:hypothetical protein